MPGSIPQKLALEADLPGAEGPSVASVLALRGKKLPWHEVAHHHRVIQSAADMEKLFKASAAVRRTHRAVLNNTGLLAVTSATMLVP